MIHFTIGRARCNVAEKKTIFVELTYDRDQFVRESDQDDEIGPDGPEMTERIKGFLASENGLGDHEWFAGITIKDVSIATDAEPGEDVPTPDPLQRKLDTERIEYLDQCSVRAWKMIAGDRMSIAHKQKWVDIAVAIDYLLRNAHEGQNINELEARLISQLGVHGWMFRAMGIFEQ